MNRMSSRTIIGLLCMTAILTLVTEANAVICPSGTFKCDLDRNAATPKVTCKYVACGGSCCCAPGSVLIDMSGHAFGQSDVGDSIVASVSPLPNPPVPGSILSGLVVCLNESGGQNWGVVNGETASVAQGFTAVTAVADNGAIAETLEATLDQDDLATLDSFCTPGHVAADFLPFSFTLGVSVVNPDGTVDQNDSIAAACVHPFPNTIGVVNKGPNKGAITGGPYECDKCPFQDADADGVADVAGCASCVNTDGELTGNCPPLGQKVKPQ